MFDFLEFTLKFFSESVITNAINHVLEKDLVAYRYVEGHITDITEPIEVEMLQSALMDNDYPTVRSHLKQALALLSDRERPDYRNSIKESISAVESLANHITGETNVTLGKALKKLDADNKIHRSLKDGWMKLYGYTSDADGIRHALLEESHLNADDAKYFLLTCTSFINYLKTRI